MNEKSFVERVTNNSKELITLKIHVNGSNLFFFNVSSMKPKIRGASVMDSLVDDRNTSEETDRQTDTESSQPAR